MKSIPGVSFIIPTYNCKKYIDRAIKSVFDQNLPDFEIIIIDDASTDGTSAHLKKTYKENNNIILVTNKVTKRTGASRNIGIKKASKDYIFFLDADDWLVSNSITFLINLATKHKAEIAAGGIEMVYENGIKTSFSAFSFKALSKSSIVLFLSKGLISSVAWGKLYDRNFLINNFLQFSEIYLHEDVSFSVTAAFKCTRLVSTKKISYYYFQRISSYTLQKPSYLYLKSYFNMLFEVIQQARENISLSNENQRLMFNNLLINNVINGLVFKTHNYFNHYPIISLNDDFINLVKNEKDSYKITIFSLIYKFVSYYLELLSISNYQINSLKKEIQSYKIEIDRINAVTLTQKQELKTVSIQNRYLMKTIDSVKQTKLWRFSEFLRSVLKVFKL